MTGEAARLLVLWCPDWPVVAAGAAAGTPQRAAVGQAGSVRARGTVFDENVDQPRPGLAIQASFSGRDDAERPAPFLRGRGEASVRRKQAVGDDGVAGAPGEFGPTQPPPAGAGVFGATQPASCGHAPGFEVDAAEDVRPDAWRYSWYDVSPGPRSCSYRALSTQAASGIAGGINPVKPSPHLSRSQSAAPEGADGHGFDCSSTRSPYGWPVGRMTSPSSTTRHGLATLGSARPRSPRTAG
jgi:hypothetical protein